MESVNDGLYLQFVREINRLSDSDRLTRKAGLQKLASGLPWNDHAGQTALLALFTKYLLKPLMATVGDSVEKCRELSLTILKSAVSKLDLSPDNIELIVRILCSRVNDIPYPEVAEELRLRILEILRDIVRKSSHTLSITVIEGVLSSLSKLLLDSFADVKRDSSDIIVAVAKIFPAAVASSFKSLQKGLLANALHQHSKTRVSSLNALRHCLVCIDMEEFDKVSIESILPTIAKCCADHAVPVRAQLADLLGQSLCHRVSVFKDVESTALQDVDFEFLSVLVTLSGDESEAVVGAASMNLKAVAGCVATGDISTGYIDNLLCQFMTSVTHKILLGVNSWTTDTRIRHLRGLRALIGQVGWAGVVKVLPSLLDCLGRAVAETDKAVREDAVKTVELLGSSCDLALSSESNCISISQPLIELPVQLGEGSILSYLLPRTQGAVAGGDTASQRASAVLLLTSLMRGFRTKISRNESEFSGANPECVALARVAATVVGSNDIHQFREANLREALLLCTRALLECLSQTIRDEPQLQAYILLALTFLQGRLAGEDETVVRAAARELTNFVTLLSASDASAAVITDNVAELYAVHFDFIFRSLCPGIAAAALSSSDSCGVASVSPHTSPTPTLAALVVASPMWAPDSPAKSAFEVLVRSSPVASWKTHNLVLPVFIAQVQPRAGPKEGSAEAIAQSYAAQRGEEFVPGASGEVDVRLSLLALLEGLIRAGGADWRCGSFLSDARLCDALFHEILLPNLIWRVGRVEATIRKVALACVHALLKAGAVPHTALFKAAPHLVPAVTSHLDDSDWSVRSMSCSSLSILFERLRGSFGDQALQEIYPSLLKRLDDSNDAIRIAICGTLEKFFLCAPPKCYNSTLVDYSLDQLFIHLDDPNLEMQHAVARTIIAGASAVNKEHVLKKSESFKSSHRNTDMCDLVTKEVQGFEILDS